MGDVRGISAPAEYFLWRRKGDTQYTNYTRVESEQGGIGDALRLFNSKKKSVRRSTGGIILAEPYQIVFDDGSRRRAEPETRIKVRFLDFRFGPNKEIVGMETAVHTKIVRPTDLGEPFTFDMAGKKFPSFVVDFGKGIVPVHIVGLAMTPDGEPLVYFVDDRDFRRVGSGRGKKHLVQFYCMHRELLRLASTDPGRGKRSEYNFALENDGNVRRMHGEVVPRALSWRASLLVPGETSIHKGRRLLEHLLEKRLESGDEEEDGSGKKGKKEKEGELTPFGIFE